jgi:hypothetical protein
VIAPTHTHPRSHSCIIGMITTRVAKDSYGREARLTAKGPRVLEASSI